MPHSPHSESKNDVSNNLHVCTLCIWFFYDSNEIKINAVFKPTPHPTHANIWGGGYIGITFSICQSLFAIVSSPYISYGGTLKDLTLHKIVYHLRMCHDSAQGHLGKAKVIDNIYLLYTFLIEKHRRFLFHRKISFDLVVYHEGDPRFV